MNTKKSTLLKLITCSGFEGEISKEIVFNNKWLFTKGLYPGLMFTTCGLGLGKREREFYERKFLEVGPIVNIYIGKLVFTYAKHGYEDVLCTLEIVEEKEISLSKYLADMKSRLKHNLIHYKIKS